MKTGFISSTILDLKDLRSLLGRDLAAHGFNMLRSEEGNIPVDSSKHSYDICLDAARSCDFLIAIIDGRFGGEVPGTGKSITLAEVEAAADQGKQVCVFVRSSVWDAKEVLRPYLKSGVPFQSSKIVQDVRVFEVIDALRTRATGNWIFTFNDAKEILNILSTQLKCQLKAQSNPDIEKLDKILARRWLAVFPSRLIEAFSEQIQIGSLWIDVADLFEEAVGVFLPQAMRFAGRESSGLFDDFMNKAVTLQAEAPSIFGPSNNPNKYTARVGIKEEVTPQWTERFENLSKLAVETQRAWIAFFDFIRAKWPDLILELHGETSDKKDSP